MLLYPCIRIVSRPNFNGQCINQTMFNFGTIFFHIIILCVLLYLAHEIPQLRLCFDWGAAQCHDWTDRCMCTPKSKLSVYRFRAHKNNIISWLAMEICHERYLLGVNGIGSFSMPFNDFHCTETWVSFKLHQQLEWFEYWECSVVITGRAENTATHSHSSRVDIVIWFFLNVTNRIKFMKSSSIFNLWDFKCW